MEPDLAEHFEASLTQVRTVPVETRAIPLAELRVAPPKKMAISSIEASLRLDAVASAGGRCVCVFEGCGVVALGLCREGRLRVEKGGCEG